MIKCYNAKMNLLKLYFHSLINDLLSSHCNNVIQPYEMLVSTSTQYLMVLNPYCLTIRKAIFTQQ